MRTRDGDGSPTAGPADGRPNVATMDASIAALFDLSGRTALVTGGATGIGEGIARVLAAAGAAVVVADIDTDGAERVAGDIGGRAVLLDVTDADACAEVVTGIEGLDLVVNNAGSYHQAGSILDQPASSWQTSININLASVFNVSQPAARAMVVAGRAGSFVNLASVDGALPCLGTGYDSAKAGVIQFTRSLALDLAPHGIRANAISPGHIEVDTLRRMRSGEIPALWPADSSVTGLMGPMMSQRSSNIPLGRSGTPDEIAHAALFLSSDAARYVTGQNLFVDGGWLLV